MSELSTPLDYLILDTHVIFSPKYLNLPALPQHLPLVLLSALFYQVVYSLVAPLLWFLIEYLKLSPTPPKVPRPIWYINIVSLSQSCVNTALAIYLLCHHEFRYGLTSQERMLGYHKETSRVLAVSMGYFVFHLGQTWVQRGVHGIFMFYHAVCALFAVSLGFRPLGLHFTATFLIWELPNIFLNFQRQFDNAGKKDAWYRAGNRILLLSTYAIFRLALGSGSLLQMAHDIFITAQDPHPRIGTEHVLPSLLRVGGEDRQEVRRLPILLTIFQIGSMTFLHLQGFYWFSKLLLKGEIRKTE